MIHIYIYPENKKILGLCLFAYIAVLRLTFVLHYIDKLWQRTDNVTFMDHSFYLFNHLEAA